MMQHKALRLAPSRRAALLASCGANPFPPVTIDFGQIAPDAPRAASMPLADKVGQLFVVPANGVFMSEESKQFQTLKHHVVDNRVGGVILFRSNVYGAAVLVGKLQEIARMPLLVSADLEAGLGMRFDDVTYGPWAMAIAATGDPTLAERGAYATAREARAIGVAQVFAPVADVNVNPDNPVINVRSFGEDPADVSRYVEATVPRPAVRPRPRDAQALPRARRHRRGLAPLARDPCPSTGQRLESVELVPFRAGIKAGAESVMIAHVSVPALDDTPAPVLPNPPRPVDAIGENVEVETTARSRRRVSVPIVTGVLRKELGFTGLVVTDAMRMGGITSHFEAGEAAIRAILAGADQILLSSDTDAAIKAVRRGREVGPHPRGAPRRERHAHPRRQEAPEAVREGHPLRREDRAASWTRRPFRRSRPRSRGARSRSCARSRALPLRKGAKLLSLVVADEATLNGPAGPLAAEIKARSPP